MADDMCDAAAGDAGVSNKGDLADDDDDVDNVNGDPVEIELDVV